MRSGSNIPTAELRVRSWTRRTAEPDPGRLRASQPRLGPAARLARQGRAGPCRPRTVQAPPLFIQEKVHPEGPDRRPPPAHVRRATRRRRQAGVPDSTCSPPSTASRATATAKTEFYQHDANWTNRMILGDSLQVMASLAEREGLRGKVQCIYLDPPYGIKFNSNFQWSTTSRDVRDGKRRPHHPRARASQSLSRHLARRHPLLPLLPPRPTSTVARDLLYGVRLDLRPDRG